MFAVRIDDVKGAALPAAPAALFPYSDSALQKEWHDDRALIVSSADPSSRSDPRLICCPQTKAMLVIWGRIYNTAELSAALGESATSSAEWALAVWRKWGADCCTRLVGEFSLAIYDPRDRSLFAIRDAMGVRPLYFARQEGGLIVATSIPALRGLATTSFEIDPHWLARYIAAISMSRENTPFIGIEKVPPGHLLRWDGDGVALKRYHHFDTEAPPGERHEESRVRAYREVLEEALRCRLDGTDPIGVETSGGIDSSTIVGFAPQMVEDPDAMLHGFGFVGAEKEPEAVIGVSRFAGLRNNHIFAGGANAEEAQNRGIAVLGHPAEHGNSTAHIPFYRLARQLGVRTLLSGFGGDEGVTNYAINHRRDLIGSGQYRALWQVLKGNPAAKALRFGKAVHRHRSGKYAEFAPNLLRGARQRAQQSWLLGDIAEAIDLREEVLDGARWHAAYDTLNGFAAGMLEKAFVSTRTESCSLLAASYGIEYSWPLLDTRLIQQWLSTPTVEKASRDMGRYLHRRALEGVVPDPVRLQVSKYMGPGLWGQTGPSKKSLDPDAFGQLQDGLHPRLAELVDQKGLSRGIDRALAMDPEDSQRVVTTRPLQHLRQLDSWLRDIDNGKLK